MDAFANGLSGVQSAGVRLAASAHNVANSLTPGFHPLRTTQASVEGGGSVARVERDPEPRGVDLGREVVSQIQAGFQFRASLRVLAASADTRGALLDIFS